MNLASSSSSTYAAASPSDRLASFRLSSAPFLKLISTSIGSHVTSNENIAYVPASIAGPAYRVTAFSTSGTTFSRFSLARAARAPRRRQSPRFTPSLRRTTDRESRRHRDRQ
jgi:hypothetical protein